MNLHLFCAVYISIRRSKNVINIFIHIIHRQYYTAYDNALFFTIKTFLRSNTNSVDFSKSREQIAYNLPV